MKYLNSELGDERVKVVAEVVRVMPAWVSIVVHDVPSLLPRIVQSLGALVSTVATALNV
jgi:hypothetical protein